MRVLAMKMMTVPAALAATAALATGCFDDSRLDPYRCKAAADCADAPRCGAGDCACEDGLCLPPKTPGTDAVAPPPDSGPGTDAVVAPTDSGPGTDAAAPGCTLAADCLVPALPVCVGMTCQACDADPAQCAMIDAMRPFCATDGRCVECRNNGDCGGMGMTCTDGTCG